MKHQKNSNNKSPEEEWAKFNKSWTHKNDGIHTWHVWYEY